MRNFLLAALTATIASSAAAQDKPALIVQITVDGFRGDLLNRYLDKFGKDGFRRLIERGVWYTDAHHRHAIPKQLSDTRRWPRAPILRSME